MRPAKLTNHSARSTELRDVIKHLILAFLSQIYHERAATDRKNVRGGLELCYRGENILFLLVSYLVQYFQS